MTPGPLTEPMATTSQGVSMPSKAPRRSFIWPDCWVLTNSLPRFRMPSTSTSLVPIESWTGA